MTDKPYEDIPGTFVFDADRARIGYHLNQFCISLRLQKNRDAFNADEERYLDAFPMSAEQRDAVLKRQWNRLLELGGNIYYTSKLAANDGINFQNLAGLMTGMSSSWQPMPFISSRMMAATLCMTRQPAGRST